MYRLIVFLVFTNILLGVYAQADMLVLAVDEENLPASLSPHSLENSPHSLSNSVHSLANSVHSLDNSPHSLANSRHNPENGKSGNHRLLIEKDGSFYYAGYYVLAESGVTNFYSMEGERLFYLPAGTDAVFSSQEGEFSGGIANRGDDTVLALVENGQILMAQSGVNIFSASTNKHEDRFFRGYLCTGDCSGHIAGYNWALEKRLSTPDQCSGKSQSFIEGCISAFVPGRAETGNTQQSPDVIESQIDGEFEGFDGETIVKLMNGQIWQQAEYWYHYHYSYMADVTIVRKGSGYKIKVEGIDKAVAVTRLR